MAKLFEALSIDSNVEIRFERGGLNCDSRFAWPESQGATHRLSRTSGNPGLRTWQRLGRLIVGNCAADYGWKVSDLLSRLDLSPIRIG